jgi:phospholipid transport system substrate-binding protein
MKKLISAAIICFLSFFACADDDIRGYVQNLLDSTFAILNDKNKTIEDKKSELGTKLANNLDSDKMARAVLGRSQISDEEISNFTTIYQKYLVKSYASSVRTYKEQKVEIGLIVQNPDDNYQVSIIISDNNNQKFNISYLVSRTSNGFKIFDVITENISLVQTQKNDFADILSNSGIQSLINELKKKTDSIE